MDTAAWIVLAAALVALAAAAVVAIRQQRRHKELRREFGSEYERVAEEKGDSKTDAELAARRRRRRKLDIRPLDPADRERYAAAWERTQARFVDAPEAALAEADELVNDVMRDRGYPVDDFEQRVTDVSVDHPEVVQNYRAGHAIAQRHAGGGTATTEDLRQAVVHYRALFAELLRDDQPDGHAMPNGHATPNGHEAAEGDPPLRPVRAGDRWSDAGERRRETR